jgi:5-methyltetrahydrofolate--homocysteine methyltransferase
MEVLEELKASVIGMELERAAELTKKALDGGLDPERILKEALIPAMDAVGEEYEQGKRYIPEMLVSAEAMKSAMEILRPLLTKSRVEPMGRVVIGTVEGDLHDIGKNLVAMMLEGGGFEVHDLGTEVTADRFVEAVREYNADLVGMSALLTTTMVYMPKVIEALKEASLRDKVKVMVGGAPLTQEYADEIGADGYAPDAASAVKLAKRLLKELKSKPLP